MKPRMLLASLVLSLVTTVVVPAALAEPGHGPGHGRGPGGKGHGMHGGKGGPGGWMAGLDLTAEQQAKMKALREKNREQVQKLREAMRAKHDELKTLLAGDGSVDKARGIHKDVQDTKRKLEDLHFESMMELRTLLTPEQRKKLAEAMGAHHGGGPGPHHGPGGSMMGFGDDGMP